MDALFWQRLHGGSTHLPIVLLPLSVIFDFVAPRMRDDAARRAFHSAGLLLALGGALGGCGAVIAGLAMTRGDLLGSGIEKVHHLFVWPAFGLSVGLAAWRLLRHKQASEFSRRFYVAAMSVACALMMGAGYWGGELLLRGETNIEFSHGPAAGLADAAPVARGHDLFLMNCAHCHGDDAHGTEEGPDLTTFRKSDTRIVSVVKNGIKGQMPRFDQKLTDEHVRLLTIFLHSVNNAAK